jgi:hypothetical protein
MSSRSPRDFAWSEGGSLCFGDPEAMPAAPPYSVAELAHKQYLASNESLTVYTYNCGASIPSQRREELSLFCR